MKGGKFILLVLAVSFTSGYAFGQSESLKTVVNNLAFYRQKKDLKYLSSAKNTVDSVIKASGDTTNLENNVYKAIVYSSIVYIDSLNKLKQSANFFEQTSAFVDRLDQNGKIYRFDADMTYVKNCLANVYIRQAFVFADRSDFTNALPLFERAHKYAPSFKELDAYIAYSNHKLGNLRDALKFYTGLVGDSAKAEYVETASDIYKTFGDTSAALDIVKKGRKVLPNDKSLLLDEANIYNNRRDYHALATLLPALLEINTNNADIAFVAANCYDHLNEYDKAESLYLHAIELNSSAYEPIFNLGLLYFKHSATDKDQEKDKAMAAQWLEKANEISPNDTNCLRVLQLVYAQLGNKDQENIINNKLKQITNQ